MNLVVLHTLILVTQLSLFTYGKPSLLEVAPVEMVANTNSARVLSESDSDHSKEVDNKLARESDDEANFIGHEEDAKSILMSKLHDVLHKMTPDPASSSCNDWNDLDSDKKIEQNLKSLLSEECNEICKIERLVKIRDFFECSKAKAAADHLLVPLRTRRGVDQGSPHISAEKKAKLDVLVNDLFVPNRGRRQLVRKSFLHLEPYPFTIEKRNNFELDNMKDFFVPHRGKRQRTINDILSDNFLPQRGKKAIDDIFADQFFPQRGKKAASIIIPKSKSTEDHVPMDFNNFNSYDRHMIDRLHDLNLLMLNTAEANKDITTAAQAALRVKELLMPPQQLYDGNNNIETMMFNPTFDVDDDDEYTSDGRANLIFTNTPHNDAPNDFTSKFI